MFFCDALATEYGNGWKNIYNYNTCKTLGYQRATENSSIILNAINSGFVLVEASSDKPFNQQRFESSLEESYYHWLSPILEKSRIRMAKEAVRCNIEIILSALKSANLKIVDKGN